MKTSLIAAALLLGSVPAQAADLDYHSVFDRWARLNTFFDADGSVNDWLSCFRPSVGQRVQGNEFAAADVRKDSVAAMKAEIGQADLKAPLTIRTEAEFGQYDFGTKRFEFRPLKDGTYFPVHPNNATSCSPNAFPGTLRVMIANPGVIDGLPMPQEAAKAFLAGRRNGTTVNRQVGVALSIRIDQLAGDDAVSGTVVGYQIVDIQSQHVSVLATSPGLAGSIP